MSIKFIKHLYLFLSFIFRRYLVGKPNTYDDNYETIIRWVKKYNTKCICRMKRFITRMYHVLQNLKNYIINYIILT